MFTYRYVLQGCNETNIAAVNRAAGAAIAGVRLPIERSALGYYFISVESQANYEKVRTEIEEVFAPLQLTVAVIKEWTPDSFSPLF